MVNPTAAYNTDEISEVKRREFTSKIDRKPDLRAPNSKNSEGNRFIQNSQL